MIILALDTTTRAGSVTVLRDEAVLAELTGDPAVTHTERLPGDLMRTLDLAGVPLASVELLAVTVGPGSFTGLRGGIATIQGLAMSLGLRVVPVTTLEALASAAGGRDCAIGVWMDAQRGEVFAALYAAGGRTVLVPPVSARAGRVLQDWAAALGDDPVVFIGDGAVRYRAEIEEALGPGAEVVAPPPLATLAGRLAATDPGRAVLPHAVVPVYVRKSDVELARDRRSGQP